MSGHPVQGRRRRRRRLRRVLAGNSLYAWHGGDRMETGDPGRPLFLELVYGGREAPPGREHRVEDEDQVLVQVAREVDVVFDWLGRLLVALEAHKADRRPRQQGERPVEHTEAGAQDGNEADGTGDLLDLRIGQGSADPNLAAICCISASPMPRVVIAAVFSLMPLVTVGGSGSLGTMFLLQVTPTASIESSSSLPVTPVCFRSTRTRWLSVPPETRSRPPSNSPVASTLQFATILRAYSSNSGCSASPRATALPAIACMSGPPCMPGKTRLLTFLANSSRHRIMPPRAPRSVLCVVVVTTSQ